MLIFSDDLELASDWSKEFELESFELLEFDLSFILRTFSRENSAAEITLESLSLKRDFQSDRVAYRRGTSENKLAGL